uniref:DUF4220 domain-containing protein n=1 Tax=Hordeum vulgare subsp. vulgare TaxID=112509 RepID=A0A8I6YYA6_HORVV
MGLSSAVDWWEEWQMRILVLGSLCVQFLLLCSAPFRKYAIPSWYRSIVWLAYLGGDAIAIYGLATLFNRQRRQDSGSANSSTSILEVVWAPVLLMHLGGQDHITAYNIEDNELWTRHLLTAVSQITVAVYVFSKSWKGGDKRLLQAAIVLFVPGILKCIEKPWTLKNASINSLVSSSDPQLMTAAGKSISLEEYVEGAIAFAQDDHVPQAQGEARADDLEANQHLQAHAEDHSDDPKPNHAPKIEHKLSTLGDMQQIDQDIINTRLRELLNLDQHINIRHPSHLFVDIASSFSDRLCVLNAFRTHYGEKAYELLQVGLFSMYDLFYTKQTMLSLPSGPIRHPWLLLCGYFLRIACLTLPYAAIGLFHSSHREAYNGHDVKVTYALFCCTAMLETYSIYAKMILILKLAASELSTEKSCVSVSQYSLIGFFARNIRHTIKMCVLSFVQCKDFLDQRWCMKPCKSSIALTELVLEYVKKGWKDQITDVESYWKFIDHRGEWTLQNKCEQDLIWSLRRPFDESVILWHIATDFCFFRCKAYPHERAREMSNYLTYLLFVKPEMLLPGTRCNLFKTANDELEAIVKQVKGDKLSLKAILKGDKPSQDILKGSKSFIQFLTGEKASQDEVEKGLMEIIFAKMKEREEVASCTELPLDADKNPAAEGLINNAWKISEALLAIDDESKMWNVIEGVWVEMLCFSASRCRGYLHAKSLGSGGELLTYIWLLLSHMGMETLPERLQRTELSTEEGNASIPPSTSQIPGSKDAPPFRRSRLHDTGARNTTS